MFSGTLKTNIDPFDDHSEEECLSVLERCHLMSMTRASGTSPLAMPINGSSLSAGEKQLVAIARAILRRTNVIIMDEATSQIDSLLDDQVRINYQILKICLIFSWQIQKAIREDFSDAIVLTIAHRLKTIVDYDRILVLGDGEIMEFDTPKNLLSKQDGAFREMCRQSADWPLLKSLVEDRY